MLKLRLDEQKPTDVVLTLIADHYACSGEESTARKYLLAAGRVAVTRGVYAEAERLVRRIAALFLVLQIDTRSAHLLLTRVCAPWWNSSPPRCSGTAGWTPT